MRLKVLLLLFFVSLTLATIPLPSLQLNRLPLPSLPSLPLISLANSLSPSTILTWEGGSIEFPSKDIERIYTKLGHYIPKNIIATKSVTYKDSTILLTPKLKSGNPCSLVIHNKMSNFVQSRFLPYPSLNNHEEGNCNTIQNAVDMYMDHLGMLWVLDTGEVDILECPRKVCPPKVVCISILTGQVVKTIDLSQMVCEHSNLQYLVVDYNSKNDAFVYVSDAETNSLLIYDVTNDAASKVLLPDDVKKSYQPNDVLYLALTRTDSGKSVLYLTYLKSSNIYSIKTSYLIKGKMSGKIIESGRKTSPIIFLGTDDASIIYFRYKNEPDVYQWDTKTQFNPDNLQPIYTSEEGFVSTGISFNKFKGMLEIVESNYQDYINNCCGVGVLHQIVQIPK